jgi:ketosteroid isomerase-like protein
VTATLPQTRENLVRSYYRLVDSNDVDGLVALFEPDSTYHRPGYPPLVGRTALERFYRGERVIDTGEHRLSTVVTDGDTTAVHGEFHGVLRDGRTVELRFADFFTFGPEGGFARRDTFFFAPMV